jgi:hypothetical protein
MEITYVIESSGQDKDHGIEDVVNRFKRLHVSKFKSNFMVRCGEEF